MTSERVLSCMGTACGRGLACTHLIDAGTDYGHYARAGQVLYAEHVLVQLRDSGWSVKCLIGTL